MNMMPLEKDVVITMIRDSGISAETQIMCNSIGYDCFSPHHSGVAGVYLRDHSSKVRALVYDDTHARNGNTPIPDGLGIMDVLRNVPDLFGVHMFNNSSIDFSEVFMQPEFLHEQSSLLNIYKVLASYNRPVEKKSFLSRLLLR